MIDLDSTDPQVKADALVMIDDALSRIDTGRFCWRKWLSNKTGAADTMSGSLARFGDAYARGHCGTTACIAGGAPFIPSLAARGLTPEAVIESEILDHDLDISSIFSALLYGDKRGSQLFDLIFYRFKSADFLGFDDSISDKHLLTMLREELTSSLQEQPI